MSPDGGGGRPRHLAVLDERGRAYCRWAHAYAAGVGGRAAADRLRELAARLGPARLAVELGCGADLATAEHLAVDCLIGVEVSRARVLAARRRWPRARVVHVEQRRFRLPAGAADAVVSLSSLIHVPPDRYEGQLRVIRSWLRPGGWLLAGLGGRWSGSPIDEAGLPGLSCFPAGRHRAALRGAGLDVVGEDLLRGPVGEAGWIEFLWVLARAR